MEMSLKALLKEASTLSFEKNIEILAAVDDGDCLCVDLHQAQIRELSEKILQLPHQGIVLLFSKHCFRLSPEKTENLFQISGAKGQLRYYSNLLSSSMGLAAARTISETSFENACQIAMKDYLRTERGKDTSVSETRKSRVRFALRQLGRVAALVAIALTVFFSTLMFTSAQFREWVVSSFEKYSVFEFKGGENDEQADLKAYKFSYLPDGAILNNTIDQIEAAGYEYTIGNSDYLTIFISKPDNRICMDTENVKVEPLDKEGLSGYSFSKEDLNYICFEQDGNFFAIFGSIDVEELIKIAVGITK